MTILPWIGGNKHQHADRYRFGCTEKICPESLISFSRSATSQTARNDRMRCEERVGFGRLGWRVIMRDSITGNTTQSASEGDGNSMTRFLRALPKTLKIYSIVVEKQCVCDNDHPYGWAELKKRVFVSRQPDDLGLQECGAVWRKFIEPKTRCMADTLYRYCITVEPPDENGGGICVFADELIKLPKGFRSQL